MYEIKLTFDQLPKSLNVTLRKHWRAQRSEGKCWDDMVALQCCNKLPDQPLQRVKIRIVRHFWQMMDYDGLVGSMKPVVDALVTAGVMIDDNWGVTGQWDVSQSKRAKKDGPLLEVTVSEL